MVTLYNKKTGESVVVHEVDVADILSQGEFMRKNPVATPARELADDAAKVAAEAEAEATAALQKAEATRIEADEAAQAVPPEALPEQEELKPVESDGAAVEIEDALPEPEKKKKSRRTKK